MRKNFGQPSLFVLLYLWQEVIVAWELLGLKITSRILGMIVIFDVFATLLLDLNDQLVQVWLIT